MKRAFIALTLALASCLAGAQATSNQIVSGSVYQDFQNTNSWVSYDANVSSDVNHVLMGKQSVLLNATPGYDAHMQTQINTNFSNVSTISFWVYVVFPLDTDFAGWHAVSIYLTSDNFQDYFLATTQQLHTGWSKLTFSKSDFTANGNPSWSSPMTKLQLAFFGDTSQGMHVSFADMELNGSSRPKVIIAFDDNYESLYTYGYTYLKKYGLSGTAFVISSMVDQPGRTTSAQLQEIYNYGWDMCNHTTTHPDLRTLTLAQVESEFSTCQKFLIGKGWTRNQGYRHLAYPYGYYNGTVIEADTEMNLLTARTVMESLPQASLIDSQYALYSQVPDSTTQTVSDILVSVDQVVADGGTLEITFHNITPTPEVAIDWNATDFETIIDAIAKLKSEGKLDVETFTQWYSVVTAQKTINYFQTNAPSSAVGVPNTGLLYLAAPSASAQTVTLTSNNPAAQVPASATFAANSGKATFPITTTWVSAPTVVSLYAGMNGKTTCCTFTILPTMPYSISLASSSLTGGGTTTGAVYLNGPSPAGGCTVTLKSSTSAVALSPAQVTIPAGWTHVTFTVQTAKVTATTNATITASYNGGSATATLTVIP